MDTGRSSGESICSCLKGFAHLPVPICTSDSHSSTRPPFAAAQRKLSLKLFGCWKQGRRGGGAESRSHLLLRRNYPGNFFVNLLVVQEAEDVTAPIDSPLQLGQDIGADICQHHGSTKMMILVEVVVDHEYAVRYLPFRLKPPEKSSIKKITTRKKITTDSTSYSPRGYWVYLRATSRARSRACGRGDLLYNRRFKVIKSKINLGNLVA